MKKIVAILCIFFLVASLVFAAMGRVSWTVFWIVAVITGIISWLMKRQA